MRRRRGRGEEEEEEEEEKQQQQEEEAQHLKQQANNQQYQQQQQQKKYLEHMGRMDTKTAESFMSFGRSRPSRPLYPSRAYAPLSGSSRGRTGSFRPQCPAS